MNVTTSPTACSCVEDSTHESPRPLGVGPESGEADCLPLLLGPTAAGRAAHRQPAAPVLPAPWPCTPSRA